MTRFFLVNDGGTNAIVQGKRCGKGEIVLERLVISFRHLGYRYLAKYEFPFV